MSCGNLLLLQFLLLIWFLLQAIEIGFGYGQWLHGEAVAAGTVIFLCCERSPLCHSYSCVLLWANRKVEPQRNTQRKTYTEYILDSINFVP